MPNARDFADEYARRLARGRAKGLSRSQSRGHARIGEVPLRPPPKTNGVVGSQLEHAIKELRKSGSLTQAAKSARMSPERLRRFLGEHAIVERSGKEWNFTNKLRWDVSIISQGQSHEVLLDSFEMASLNGQHQAAVKAFLSSGNTKLLKPFEGQSVIDTKGKAYPLETNPSTLYRLANTGSEVFESIYRLTY